MKVSAHLSRTFEIARLFAILLVIAIHYNNTGVIEDRSAGNLNYALQDYIADGIARTGVPLFALAAGFFFFLNYAGITSYRSKLRGRLRTLFLPYLLYSAGASLLFITAKTIVKGPYHVNIGYTLVEIIGKSRAGQLWFLRDLMVLMLASPIVLLLTRALRGFFLLLLGIAWALELQVFPRVAFYYLVNIDTLFFFACGCYLAPRVGLLERLVTVKRSWKLLTTVACLGLFAARVYVNPTFDLWYTRGFTVYSLLLQKAGILTGVVALIMLSSLPVFNKRWIIYISGYSFFAYLFHEYPLLGIVNGVSDLLVGKEYTFYVSFPMATLLVFLGAFICERYLNRVYRLFTGNRGPGKILERLDSASGL